MTDQPIRIDTSAKPSVPKKRLGWLYGVAALAVGCYLASLLAVFPGSPDSETEKVISAETATPAQAASTDGEPVDESKLQWISPTSGPPITLEFVPRGTQVILHLRPANLLAHGEGPKIRATLGPWGEKMVGRLEQLCGAELSAIESLLVALIRVDDRWDYALRATFSEARAELPAVNEGRAAFLPAGGQGRVLVSCPAAIAAELNEQGDSPALLTRDLERLLPLTDQQRSVTLLMPARFLDIEGSELFLNDEGAEKLIAAFDALIPDNASAVLVSCDWRANFFWELATTIVQNAPAHRFNAEFATRLQDAEKQLAESLAANPASRYGKAVEEQFPAMLRVVSNFTRVSHEDGMALARCYLPIRAGHNLLLASRLRLGTPAAPTAATAAELPLADRLQQPTTLSFPRETLENALEMLAADARLPVQIAGRDLQLEGITKNQTFSLDLRDRPAEEILVEVLRRANPDRGATGPSDPRQKLVYVIRGNVIVVTTRAAIARSGEELPEVFRGSPP